MKLKHALPGLVWIVIGAGIHIYATQTGTKLTLMGTDIPWGFAVIAAGVLIALWDMWRKRKEL